MLVVIRQALPVAKPAAAFAMTRGGPAGAGPPVGEKTIHIVEQIDFANDGRHPAREIRGKHTGLVQPWGFAVANRVSVGPPFKPLRMRLQGFFISPVAIQAGDHPDTARLGRLSEITEKVLIAEVLALVLVGDFGWG